MVVFIKKKSWIDWSLEGPSEQSNDTSSETIINENLLQFNDRGRSITFTTDDKHTELNEM